MDPLPSDRLDIDVKRLPERLEPDPSRVILRFFRPGADKRVRGILDRILGLPPADVERVLGRVRKRFGPKHPDLDLALLQHYEEVSRFLPTEDQIAENRRKLIGAYFTMEYAIESAALFNPSMVPAQDQSGLAEGSTRFLLSLRAVGEGHISSIVFRTGVIDRDCHVRIDPISPYAHPLKIIENPTYSREVFRLKLIEMGGYTPLAEVVFDRLQPSFDLRSLNEILDWIRVEHGETGMTRQTADNMLSLAQSNYQIQIPKGMDASQAVIFPFSETESQGIEDARLVLFTDDDGSRRIYGTYTAYDGAHVVPQIMESDGRTIKVHTISGWYAQNKGMALFPRKLDGMFAMISRLDNENIFLMYSENVRFWNTARLVQSPKFPWELIQIGNCGSPLETEEGWLLLTHGVGPMRQYCIGATLLDLADPSRVIGQTEKPLLIPRGEERMGYVPNVVYSCGGMIHNGNLIIPYGFSDIATGFARVPLAELLSLLRNGG
jgi:predicted GH43/DUF377 family glycosyl hydrolase